jgi:hypothetical protein
VAVGNTMFQVFQAFSDMLQAYVSSVSVVTDVCFKCFIRMLQKYIMMLHMLQWLYMYIADVCSNVACVAMVVYVCCRRLFLIFYLFFRRMLQVCLSGCCICLTHML